MINRRKDMKVQVRPEMKGGQGEVTVLHMVDCDDQPNVRFIGEMTIPESASIGTHGHDKETEYYVILEGIGIVTEKDGDHKVGKGEIVITGGGATHAIRNGGHTPLKVLAFIVTE
ncbi:MAG: cupin domain-containing protein [Kiritimatiellia bacterium]|jgi:mannose-6-phosphate isomerase-like protein (cupin superfamily)|nr:cupin domain-containing protein [Kiritimatiellia bacterium]